MIYEIHGKQVVHNSGECGIYRAPNPLRRMEYATMDMDFLVRTINGRPLEKAIDAVTQLRDLAAQQATWQHTPQNPGFPILIQHPEPNTTIAEVRANIQNTENFCNAVLTALKGE